MKFPKEKLSFIAITIWPLYGATVMGMFAQCAMIMIHMFVNYVVGNFQGV